MPGIRQTVDHLPGARPARARLLVLDNLSRHVASHLWSTIEKLGPDQADLRAAEVHRWWRGSPPAQRPTRKSAASVPASGGSRNGWTTEPRQRQPPPSTFVEYVEARYEHLRALLEHAAAAGDG